MQRANIFVPTGKPLPRSLLKKKTLWLSRLFSRGNTESCAEPETAFDVTGAIQNLPQPLELDRTDLYRLAPGLLALEDVNKRSFSASIFHWQQLTRSSILGAEYDANPIDDDAGCHIEESNAESSQEQSTIKLNSNLKFEYEKQYQLWKSINDVLIESLNWASKHTAMITPYQKRELSQLIKRGLVCEENWQFALQELKADPVSEEKKETTEENREIVIE